jgi:hypothetical protein
VAGYLQCVATKFCSKLVYDSADGRCKVINLIFSKARQYKIGIMLAITQFAPDANTEAPVLLTYMGIEAFNAVIARVAPLLANANCAEWQRNIIVNNK